MKGNSFLKSIKIFAILVLAGLSASYAFAQTRAISGTVVDSQNVPVIGASVMVVGQTTVGTVTDLDGKFSLNVPAGSSISVSFIGYETQVIAVGNQSVFNIVLADDAEFLEETVVIGYGVQKKSDLTGSVASVKDSDLANRSTVSAVQALQGKAAGVQIVNASGAPGSSSSIQIRGYSSNSSTRPLMIVDGLKVSSIDYLDPDNIASIEVLKDAASAAIYGIEAGNGVILVTTKSGASGGGTGRVFFNHMTSIQEVAHLPELMDAKTFLAYNELAGVNTASFQYDGVTDTNWREYMFEKGLTMRNTIGAQASNDRGNIYMALTYLTDNGIITGDKDIQKRLSGQINAEYKINNWLSIGTNNTIERTVIKSVSESGAVQNNVMGSIMVYDPLTPWTYDNNNIPDRIKSTMDIYTYPKDENGNIYGSSPLASNNLIFHPAVMRDRADANRMSFNLRGTAYANITPIKGLVFTSRLGYRAGYTESSTYNYFLNINATNKQDMSLSGTNSSNLFYQWENFANYTKNIGKHSLNAMAGFSFQKSHSNSVSGTTYQLSESKPNFRYLSYSVNDSRMTVSGAPSESSNMSYYGRLGWSYGNKYMLQANFRADAYDTSKLSPENRWGYFPSVSAGWTISNEPFMQGVKDATGLTFMKFRASWGINGNVNAMGNYQYKGTLNSGAANGYNFFETGSRVIGVGPGGTFPNPKIKWETSRQLDLGLDLRFFKERLNVTVDWYTKNTNDLITSTEAPYHTGSSTMYINAGKINNTGTEVEIGWKDNIGDFSYSINGNFATLHNMVLEGLSASRINGQRIWGSSYITYFEEGYPLWYLRLYEIDHIDQETGAAVYKDSDGNGVINDNDRVFAGSGIPDLTYGVTVNLAYKGFDLIVYGTGEHGAEKYFAMTRGDNFSGNTLAEFYTKAWQSPSSTGYIHPKPSNRDRYIVCSTDRLYDASFFKIKQIQLGYTIPRAFASKIKLSNCRVYVSLDDWFTFTKYPGLDPETSHFSQSASGLGIDYGSYPISKKLVFGLNVSF